MTGAQQTVVLAVDVGGTKTAAALVTADGTVLRRAATPTPATDGPDAVVAAVVQVADRLLAEPDAWSVQAVGVGTAGAVDVDRGVVVASTDTFADWAGTPLRDLLARRLTPLLGAEPLVHVQNDADAHAWGEVRCGAARGAATALVVAVGTGVGAALVVDGRPVRGAHHLAGDLAHVPVPGADDLRCPCGRTGHLEAVASGVGLHRRYASLGGTRATTGRQVAALAADGDPLAQQSLQDAARALGLALAGAVALVDPDVVVLTGGVTAAGPAWWEQVRATVRNAVAGDPERVRVVPGALGDDAALVGAAVAAWEAAGVHGGEPNEEEVRGARGAR